MVVGSNPIALQRTIICSLSILLHSADSSACKHGVPRHSHQHCNIDAIPRGNSAEDWSIRKTSFWNCGPFLPIDFSKTSICILRMSTARRSPKSCIRNSIWINIWRINPLPPMTLKSRERSHQRTLLHPLQTLLPSKRTSYSQKRKLIFQLRKKHFLYFPPFFLLFIVLISTSSSAFDPHCLSTTTEDQYVFDWWDGHLLRTYITGFLKYCIQSKSKLNSTSSLYNNWNLCVTGTGRLSTSQPNVQSLPKVFFYRFMNYCP